MKFIVHIQIRFQNIILVYIRKKGRKDFHEIKEQLLKLLFPINTSLF